MSISAFGKPISRDRCLRPAATLLVALLSLVVTLGVWRQTKEAAAERAHALFDQRAGELARSLASQVVTYEQVLQGARGLFAANHSVAAADWQAYVHELAFGALDPQMQSLFVLRAATTEEVEKPSGVFLAYAEGSAPPMVAEQDLQSDAVYADPLARARDTARPAAALAGRSGEIALFLPIYRSGMAVDTVDRRRQALAAYVGCIIQAEAMAQSAAAALARFTADPLNGMAFSIVDVTDAGHTERLYDSGEPASPAAFVSQVSFPVADRQWSLKVRSLPSLLAGRGLDRTGAATLVVALFGLLVTGLTHVLTMLLRSRSELHAAYTKLTEREMELDRLAHVDPLTGLANRRHFFQAGSAEWGRAQRHDRALSVMMVDIDHFKAINDTYGHGVGDETLRVLAAACKATLRECDLMARIGGEEFAVILVDTALPAADAVAERLRLAATQATVSTFEGGSLSVGVSVGVASRELDDETLDDLVRRADQALYSAKAGGRNRVVSLGAVVTRSVVGPP